MIVRKCCLDFVCTIVISVRSSTFIQATDRAKVVRAQGAAAVWAKMPMLRARSGGLIEAL